MQILSVIGYGLTTIALAILSYKTANENIGQVLGFAFVIKMVAHVGVAPIISALAERIQRKPFLVFLASAVLVNTVVFIG